MAENIANFSLTYSGALADNNTIDFYDVSQALAGFQRSLALTTHLILTGDIITQAPSLSGARILVSTPEAGSWKLTAIVLSLGPTIYGLGTADKNTPLGNLVSSAYDYVISQSLGFHVDYSKTLGQQIEERNQQEHGVVVSPQSKLDSLIEKCEASVKAMHRPITASETAESAAIASMVGGRAIPVGPPMNRQTYEYLAYTAEGESPEEFLGRISSYNLNTYKGRLFSVTEGRPIPFELAESARQRRNVRSIVQSLSDNAQGNSNEPNIAMRALSYVSRTGRMKRLLVVDVRGLDGTP